MATYTITSANTNIDTLTTKAGGDTYNINGTTASLIIDQDSRYGLNQNTSAILGPVNPSATLGGSVIIDARYVRLIPYNTGSGTVPADGITITQGGASGKLIGVYSALNVAPTAAGGSMPASGYIKIKAWNSVAFSAGALTGTGLTATATGADVVGWIEVVGQDGSAFTMNRLNNTSDDLWKGAWYQIGTTGGSRTDTYQIPTNGVDQYFSGVYVETGVGTDTYELYPVTTDSALAASVGTGATEGKHCWISTTGVLRFGHDGTNSTGGYLPTSGLKIRIGNIFCNSATSAAKTANTLNATLVSRFRVLTNTAGKMTGSKAHISWGMTSTANAYAINLEDCTITTAFGTSVCASPVVLTRCCVAPTVAYTSHIVSFSSSPQGFVFTDCVFSSGALGATANKFNMNIANTNGLYATRCRFVATGDKGTLTQYNLNLTTCVGGEFEDCTFGVGEWAMATTSGITFTGTTVFYGSGSGGKSPLSNSGTLLSAISFCSDITVDTVTFPTGGNSVPRGGLLSTLSGSNNITFRNIGSRATPIAAGETPVYDASWSRVTTTVTVTKVAHGYRVGDSVVVFISDNTSAIVETNKTILATPTADTFTFAGNNVGSTSGVLSYYVGYTGTLFTIGASSFDIKAQNIHFTGNTGVLYTSNNTTVGFDYEDITTDPLYTAPPVPAANNLRQRSITESAVLITQQSAVAGTHFKEAFVRAINSGATGLSWSRSTTVVTITSSNHGLTSRDRIQIYSSSVQAALPNGVYTITATNKDTIVVTGVNTGATSGTASYRLYDASLTVHMNETNALTTSQVTVNSGTPAFTGSGTLSAPTVGDQITWEMPDYAIGFNSFPQFIPIIQLTSGSTTAFDLAYAIDTGSGYSSFKNLYYPRAGGGGSSASTTVTMTSTTGVAVGDYVWGVGIADGATVSSITNSTDIVVSAANTATVSGTLVFGKLPSEGTMPSTGCKFKIRLTTNTANSVAVVSIVIPATSTSTTRGYLHNQADQYTLTLDGLVTGSDIVILDAGTTTPLVNVDANAGTSYDYTYYWTTDFDVDICIYKTGYVPYIIRSFTLSNGDGSIPIGQVVDRNYRNP